MTAEPLVRESVRRFENAVHALTEPQAEWVNGRCKWVDAPYKRLRGALTSRTTSNRKTMAVSRPPLRMDVLDLLATIDSSVSTWCSDGADTVERLHALAERRWAPDAAEQLDGWVARLEGWLDTAHELLHDTPPVVPLRLPCPACGRRYHYKRSGNETIRTDALRLGEDGATCTACHARWDFERLPFLAKMLGCTPAYETTRHR